MSVSSHAGHSVHKQGWWPLTTGRAVGVKGHPCEGKLCALMARSWV